MYVLVLIYFFCSKHKQLVIVSFKTLHCKCFVLSIESQVKKINRKIRILLFWVTNMNLIDELLHVSNKLKLVKQVVVMLFYGRKNHKSMNNILLAIFYGNSRDM